ncbi:methyltransferase domain-containing protein [Gryllotalpicola ginsengisoli]|uniref:methyltransferase domain-containing protein n=1 Tax=Gryllotalpicola ginsengisoli TaxID=444608 RepID=UPI0003B53385|nr:methyltransferase domain-containing protein [Gryllotalpicola ginsengisoli]
MSVQTLAAWLRCPNCFLDLFEVTDAPSAVLGCASGHRFDVNRRGYVTLLPPRSKVVGDSPEMLDAREALLASGAYAPIRDALIAAVRPAAPTRVLDSGTGTGWYLHGLLDALGSGARGLASDLSPVAVARAARGRPEIDGLVADVHAPLPVRAGVADAVTVVFAPRNAAEFARVLRPGGLLAIVTPRADHLAELRERSGMLDVPAGKAEALTVDLDLWFSPASSEHVRYALPVDEARARQLVGMGPSARHAAAASALTSTAGALPPAVTVSVDVLAFTRR